jgi:hypothetical protein
LDQPADIHRWWVTLLPWSGAGSEQDVVTMGNSERAKVAGRPQVSEGRLPGAPIPDGAATACMHMVSAREGSADLDRLALQEEYQNWRTRMGFHPSPETWAKYVRLVEDSLSLGAIFPYE